MTSQDKTDKMPPIMHVHLKRVPVALWRRFRAVAASKGATVQDQLVIVLNDYLKTAKVK